MYNSNRMNKAQKMKIDKKYILKEIFGYQNILLYILTFLMSTISLKGILMPFGLAMVAACVGESVPIIGVFVSALVATFYAFGAKEAVKFVATIVIYVFIILNSRSKVAIEERNEAVKTGGKLFGSIVTVSIFTAIFTGFKFSKIFLGIIDGAIVYSVYKLFVNGFFYLKNFDYKEVFTSEELIATAVMISIAATKFSFVNVFLINISVLTCIFLIMLIGYRKGIFSGLAAGIALSVVGLVFLDLRLELVFFVLAGLFGGLYKKTNRFGIVAVFICGNVLLYYYAKNELVILYLRQIFICSILLLAFPQDIRVELEKIFDKTRYLESDHGYTLDGTIEIVEEDKPIQELFDEFVNSRESIELEKENFVQDFLDNIEELKNNIFYDEISNEDNEIAKDICIVVFANKLITDKQCIKVLNKHNNFVFMSDPTTKDDLQEIVKIANRTYKKYQEKKAKEKEEEARFLKELERKAKLQEEKFIQKEIAILSKLKEKMVSAELVKVKQLKNEKYMIEIKYDSSDLRVREKDTTVNIASIISKELGSKVVFQRERIVENPKEYYQVYASEDKYILQVGSSKVVKDGSLYSGECSLQIKLADGKYLLSMADGLDSGEVARENSKIVLKLIKQLLASGYNNTTFELVKSKMSLINNKNVAFDSTVLDLYTGKIDLLKLKAQNTYVKNKRTIKEYNTTDISNLDMTSFEVSDGDIIVMLSDGVVNVEPGEFNWMKEFLKNVSTNNVQKMADLILEEAIENSFGIAQDDMTIIVCKVVKKSK